MNSLLIQVMKLKVKNLFWMSVVLIVLHMGGIFHHMFEKDFFQHFHYPYDVNLHTLTQQLRRNEMPSIKPINTYNYSHITNCKHKCDADLDLVYIVKSAVGHFDRRLAVRQTWGNESRFVGLNIRTLFLLGVTSNSKLQKRVEEEYHHFRDIVQVNFVDAYHNNTIKTMMGFKWAAIACPRSKFYTFVDDDMYVSTKNLLLFLRNHTGYPDYLKNQNLSPVERRAQFDRFNLPSVPQLYTGRVETTSSPIRVAFSKWYVTLEEYPYNYYPAYVLGGAYIVSNDVVYNLYYTSFYTKHFKLDDVFLGIVSLKAGIQPYNAEHMYLYHKKIYDPAGYIYVIASHGYGNPNELVDIWKEQKLMGNA